jgi:glycyl-tRNA synthetase
MVDCKESKLRYRADQLFASPIVLRENSETVGWICVQEANDADMLKGAKKMAKKIMKGNGHKGKEIEGFNFRDLTEVSEEEMQQIPSPGSGEPTLTMPRDFNLMFQTNVGAMTDASSVAYLRPETAQGIFMNFKNALGTSRAKIPFGIAQIGKAFRNEITPRNFIFRSREFEQMEVEYFIPPGDDVWQPYHEKWMQDSKDFLTSIGLREDLMGWDVHEGDGLAHYARACTDITFRFPFGVQELMGIAARGNYDLTSHSEGSGKSKYCFKVRPPLFDSSKFVYPILTLASFQINFQPSTILMKRQRRNIFPTVSSLPLELIDSYLHLSALHTLKMK